MVDERAVGVIMVWPEETGVLLAPCISIGVHGRQLLYLGSIT
jgi:hypothetical protein